MGALRLVAACVVLVISGCASLYTYEFQHDKSIKPLGKNKLSGRTLALDFSAVPENYITQGSGGNRFEVNGIRDSTERLTRNLFANEKWTSDPSKADYVLKLDLGLSLRAGRSNTRCEVRARWNIIQRGKLVGDATANGASAFPALGNGGRNCELASLEAISNGLDAALNRM